MRILLASDLHYALPQFDVVVRIAGEFDLVVLAGDHLDIGSSVALDAQIVVVSRYFELLRDTTRLVVSSGNHDLTGDDANGERAAVWLDDVRAAGIATDGDTIDVGGTLVTVCPWWDGPIGRAAVDAQLERDAARRGDRWVVVYHWPPAGSPTTWTGRSFYGDADLAGWIDRFAPDVVLAGHVHQPPFQADGSWCDRIGDTWVFNPGRQTGPMPTIVEIDLAAGTASWHSLAGAEAVDLAGSPPAIAQ